MPFTVIEPPSDLSTEELRQWIVDQFEKLARELAETIALELRPIHVAPIKPRAGMIVSADGTDWNPGAGAGAYEFIGGTWNKL